MNGLEGISKLLLELEAELSPSKQSAKFKYQILSKITNNLANKCL